MQFWVVLLYYPVKKKQKASCKLSEIKTLFTTTGIYEGKVNGYAHYILVKDFSRECLDSTQMMSMAYSYLDTLSTKKPANVLKFYFSDKDFIPGESQDITEIDKSALFTVIFDKDFKIYQLFFYNDEGNISYSGQRWKPNEQ